jgi:DUF4097 and DUF4098 domain-containing protein YvlB
MSMVRTFIRATALLCLASTTVMAQSSRERDLERRAERLGKTIEKSVEATVEQALRSAALSLKHVDIDDIVRSSVAGVWVPDVNGLVLESLDDAMRSLESTFAGLERLQDDLPRSRSGQQGQGSNRPRTRSGQNQNQNQDQDWEQGSSRIDTTFAFSRDGTVDLTTFYGDITVTGWDRNEARVRATSERGFVRGRFSRNRISVDADMSRGRNQSTYEVMVPHGSRVVVRSMSGNLTVRGVRGAVDAHTNNGDVIVTDAAERIEMGSLSGRVTGSGLRGSVEATSLNGEVHLTDVEGRSVQAESTSGNIVLENVRSPDVEGSTVSGRVSFSGPLAAGGTYGFQSHSGEVSLRVPANTSARFAIETFSGSLDSDFQVVLQPNRERRSGRRLEFTVGDGDARVVAESFSGSITIRRDNQRR